MGEALSPTSLADVLSERIGKLIEDTLAEHGGGFVDGWIGWVNYTAPDGKPSFASICPPEQVLSSALGMAHAQVIDIDRMFKRYLDGRDEDDD